MQITILGAAGRIGQEVVRAAVQKGYKIKVLVRDPEKLGVLKSDVEIIQGNLLDALMVEKSMSGSEVVINLSGAAKEPDQVVKFQKIGEIIIEKLKILGIKRLINISAAVAILPNERLELRRRLLRTVTYLFYREMKQVQDTVMKIIIEQNDIDWTLIRPAFITDKKSSGNIIVNDKKLPGISVTLRDLGKFIVDQIESRNWIHKGPMITSV
jgi:putative NADH-flavin reductase